MGFPPRARCTFSSASAAAKIGALSIRFGLGWAQMARTMGVEVEVMDFGFRAGIDSYSAFRENDRDTPTGLAGYLRERGADDLHFVGLAHDFCVAWSAMDARALGFRATVIEAATRAIDLDGSRDAARTAMRDAGVTLA